MYSVYMTARARRFFPSIFVAIGLLIFPLFAAADIEWGWMHWPPQPHPQTHAYQASFTWPNAEALAEHLCTVPPTGRPDGEVNQIWQDGGNESLIMKMVNCRFPAISPQGPVWIGFGGYGMISEDPCARSPWLDFPACCPPGSEWDTELRLCVTECPQGTHYDEQLKMCRKIESEACEANPILIGTGEKREREVDYRAPGSPLSITRMYVGDLNLDRHSHGWLRQNNQQPVFQKTFPRFTKLTDWKQSQWSGVIQQFKVDLKPWARFKHPVWRLAEDHRLVDTGLGDVIAYRGDGRENVFRFGLSRDFPEAQLHRNIEGYAWLIEHGTTKEYYDAQGRIVLIINGTHDSLSMEYDATGRRIRMTDQYGRSLQYRYEIDRLSEIEDPAGNIYRYEYDELERLIRVIYPDNASRIYHYEDARFTNALTGITDENGGRYATWAYDDQGRAVLSEHAGGTDRTQIQYLANNTVTVTKTIADGNTLTQTHNLAVSGNGFVIRPGTITGGPCATCGQHQQTTYDANGYVATRRDWNGNLTTYVHDAQGLELSRTEAVGKPEARTVGTEWNGALRLPTRITEQGKITDYGYDAKGNLLAETVTDTSTGELRTTSYTYNSHDQLLTINGPRSDVNDVTTFEYDAQGNRIRMINALNQVTEIPDYDAHGNPLRIVDPNGIVTTLAYDARQKLKSRTVAAGTPEAATTRFEYDGVGNLRKIIQPNGAFLLYRYDTAYRLTGIEDNFGNRIEYTLDLAGNRKAEQIYDPDGNLVKTQSAIFNSLSRMTESIGAAGSSSGAGPSITHYRYDNNGNQTEITDPKNQTTISGFDALNRLIRITDTALGKTEYTYNALDQLTGVEDPKGLITEYRRNAFGETRVQISPDTGITHYQYDPAGNQIDKTDARGIAVAYRYDALNRLTDIEYPDPSENIRYVYDQGANGIGRLSRIEDQSGITEYRHDARGNVLEVVFTPSLAGEGWGEEVINGVIALITQYRYDPADNIIEMTYPSGRIINYIRDPLGRIVRVDSDGRILADSIHYLPFGPLKSLSYGNGLTETRDYDLDYRITGISVPGVHELSYDYDPNSNIKEILNLADTARNQSFGYDTLDRLTSAAGGYGTLGYSYDPLGNRLQEVQTTEGTEQTEIYQYGTQNHHLLQRGSINYQYDAVGNTIHNSTQAFIYNQMNRLSRVEQDGAQIAEYRYNALGQRTSKTTGAVDTTDYLALADEQEALAEQHLSDAAMQQDQADALEMSAADLEQQAADKQFEAGNLRTLAATDRTEAEALEAEAVAAEANGQTWNTQAQSFRNQIVQPPQNFIQNLLNALYTLAADVAQAVADFYTAQADDLRTEAHALRDSADQKEQEATILETEAALLLANAEQARTLANQLRGEAAALIALAEAAEGLAEEYRQLAENPPQTQATTLFVYNQAGQLIGEYDREGNTIKEYAWLDDKPLAMLQNDNAFYYHADHLNTPQMITDQQQTIAWKAEYKPFGEVGITINTVENNLRFPGQYFDAETGLSYNYHRYYDPATDRYITSDPIGLRGGLNTYLYANANPLIFTDPLGLFVNPADVYNDVRDMRVDGHQRYPGERNSSMRHCVISCLVAKKYGIPVSAAAGTVNEYQGFYMHDLPNIRQRMTGGPWAFQPRDFADNYQGYKCSQENPEQCSTKDEPPEATCARCCASSQ